MAALVLDEKERETRFINYNNLIEDSASFEKERSMINPWNQEEEQVFMEKLATLGKDFAKISSFLSHKTTADCIEFYYKNHKSESFRDVKKQLNLRKQWRCFPTNTYMVTSGKTWNRIINAASLDMLGTGVLTGEAVSSSVTSSISPWVKVKFMRMSRPLTPEVTQTIEEEDTCSDEACGDLESVDWTNEEKFLFIQALGMYAKDFARISHCVGTKSREQCKTFFSKARKCLKLDQILQGAGNGGTQMSDANGGSSDPDESTEHVSYT